MFFVIVFLVFGLSAQSAEMKPFLLEHYGWTIDIKQGGRFDFWNIECSATTQLLPKDGVNVFKNWVCRQKDKEYWTVSLWRVPSVKSTAIEAMVYRTMSEGLGYGKVTCREEVFPSAADPKGVINDCEVPLQHGTFYVSFYHFNIPMPEGSTFVDNDGKKPETLGFTIWVQNAGISNPAVKGRLRELVSAIRKK